MTGDGDAGAGVMDNPYGALVGAGEDGAHWAFGGGFADPLQGLDLTVPAGVDGAALAAYCLMLGDDALVQAQRLTGWCTRAPELEEEVALANQALDLLGQARVLYARAAAADPRCVPALPPGAPAPPEDRLAFFRDAEGFRNVRLLELPHGDFAETVVRLLVVAAWRLALLDGLRGSTDPVLAALAAKAVKEVAYHRDWAARWFVVLADGTAESARRLAAGVASVWPHVGELAAPDPVTGALLSGGAAADPERAWARAAGVLEEVFGAAGVPVPAVAPSGPAGRVGHHTPWLVELLAEMQSVARAHPMGRW